jgi:hypothetical protein
MRTAALLLVIASVALAQADRYENAKHGFSLQPPTGWATQEADDGSGVVFSAPDGRAKMIFMPLPVPEGATFAQVLAAFEGYVRQSQPNLALEPLTQANTRVAGREVLERSYRIEEGGVESGQAFVTIFLVGRLSLTVYCNGAGEAFAEREQAMRSALGTVRFGGGGDDRQRKLDALKAAHEAGILSDEEYERKKAELTGGAVEEATRRKLAALEKAHAAGILSDEELARKKAELLGGTAPPTSSAATGEARYRDGRLGYEFRHPRAWNAQAFPNNRGISLTHGESSVNVLVFPGAKSAQELAASITGSISKQWKDYRELGRGQTTVAGGTAPVVEFAGINPRGTAVRSKLAAALAGGNGYVFLLTAKEAEYEASHAVWLGVVGSFRAGGGEPTKKAGREYRHPIGFHFWHPGNWTVKEAGDGLQLIPDDAGQRPEGPTELYFIGGDTVAGMGITSPDHPQVVAYMDQQVKSITPMLQRVGGIDWVDMSKGKGAVLTWEMKNDRNELVRAQAFVCIIRDSGIALITLGLADQVAKRQQDVRKMFASFGLDEGEHDPALVGTWTLVSTYALSNEMGRAVGAESDYTMARSVSEDSSTLVLNADGTWTKTTISQFLAMGAHNPITGTNIILDSGPTKTVSRGRWNAGGGWLYLIWEDGSWEDYKYELQGRQLKLKSGSTAEVWTAR